MRNKLKKVLIISLITSIVLYFLGLLTGLRYGSEISNIFESKSNKLVNEIKKVSNEIDELRVLILSNFLSEESKCLLLERMLDKTQLLKIEYYKILPSRLEEYELKENLPPHYLETKASYGELQLKEWLLVMNLRDCNEKILPILYFYKPKCEECVKQGDEMDKMIDFLKENGFLPFVYTIDITSSTPILPLLKDVYNVSDAPSFIFINKTFPSFTDFETFKLYFYETYEKRE